MFWALSNEEYDIIIKLLEKVIQDKEKKTLIPVLNQFQQERRKNTQVTMWAKL